MKTSAPPALRWRLRNETRQAHLRLEALLPIGNSTLSREIYRDHLSFLLGFHLPVEDRLQRSSQLQHALPDLLSRFKSEKLRADLDILGDIPQAPNAPRPTEIGQAFGVLYVLEGATLGARSLLPTLRAQGIVPGPIGTRYFEGYGAATAARWSAFCDALDELESEQADAAVVWAERTFGALEAWWRNRSGTAAKTTN